ncbi:MAG: BatA domain-containing protein, partial [Phycisphaeraceae bacterium]|nr:BatA domain-containing protein [Phycisphaeraceae bacterium]
MTYTHRVYFVRVGRFIRLWGTCVGDVRQAQILIVNGIIKLKQGILILPGFFAPLMSLLALLALPILVFYFLKLKRQRLEVSSLVLWQQVLADQRVNAPFQKFKRNILLLLQLIALLLLVLAAMQPYWPSQAERAQRVPILIDCSASMAAFDDPTKNTNTPGGGGGSGGNQSRLDAAKAHVQALIDGLLSDQQLC